MIVLFQKNLTLTLTLNFQRSYCLFNIQRFQENLSQYLLLILHLQYWANIKITTIKFHTLPNHSFTTKFRKEERRRKERSIDFWIPGKSAAIELAGRIAGEASKEEFQGERLSRETDRSVSRELCGSRAEHEHRRLLLHRSTFASTVAEDPAVDNDRRFAVRNRRRWCRWSWRWRWRS